MAPERPVTLRTETIFHIVILILQISITVLVSTKSAYGDDLSELISARVEFVDEDRNVLNDDQQVKSLTLLFPLISGNIGGDYTLGSILEVNVSPDNSFQLDLGQIEGRVANHSSSMVPISPDPSVIIEPSDAKLARVGTVAMDKSKKRGFGGGLIDPTSRDILMLMYFDGACTIRGNISEQGRTAVLNISITKSGFSWLRVSKQVENRYLITASDATPNFHFYVIIPSAKK